MKTIYNFVLSALILFSIPVYSQWVNTSVPNSDTFNAMHFPSVNTGYATSNDTTIRTTNGGLNWVMITSPFNVCTAMFFVNNTTGFISSYNKVYKTTNSGNNWIQYSTGLGFYASNTLFFINETTGWIGGENGSLAKTTNAGVNWVVLAGVSDGIRQIVFINSTTGWLCKSTASPSIYKTTNGGSQWLPQATPNSNNLYSIFMNPDGISGLACGKDGKIYTTVNGGTDWIERITPVNVPLQEICFAGTMAYCTGFNGKILKSFDNGVTWYEMTSGVTDHLVNMHFFDQNTGIISGYFGQVLRTTNGGGELLGIHPESNTNPEKFALSQNYPNPFNPATNIRIQMPKEGFAKLTVFDVTGKEIAVLVNEDLKVGEYNVDFNASSLTSGVYFYKLITEGFTDVKKMMLVK
jgi:photosystem II stability/assembly factor-like uncharacterized protein